MALIQNTGPESDSVFTDTVGYSFRVGSSFLSVTQLGVWDQNTDGLNRPNSIGLWDDAGSLLGSVVIPMGQVAPLDGKFRYHPLSLPVILSPNTVYVLGAFAPDGGEYRAQNDGFRPPTFSAGAVLVGSRRNNIQFTFSFPTANESYPGQSIMGPNLQYDVVPVPEPSAALLAACAGLILAVRRGKSCPSQTMNAIKATAVLLALLSISAPSATAQNNLVPLLKIPQELTPTFAETGIDPYSLGSKARFAASHGDGDRLPAQRNSHNQQIREYVEDRAKRAEAQLTTLTGEENVLPREDWEKLTQGLIKLEQKIAHQKTLEKAAAKPTAPANRDPRAQQRREADEWWAAEMQRQATKKQIEDTVRQELDNRRRFGR